MKFEWNINLTATSEISEEIVRNIFIPEKVKPKLSDIVVVHL